ncbi:MAG TPA: toprim domain-containing protein [Candidatus Paceibacterota bacterium]|nr:toprim domain-containing protein [Candidatus Paceibacterota bacterium]
MDPLERLSTLFERFPGIGPRQANRFVQFLLRSSPALRRELVDAIAAVGSGVHQCPQCMRFHAGTSKRCGICSNPQRDTRILAVVATDTDLLALERSGTFRGYYFVIGGTVSLASEKGDNLRTSQLLDSLPARGDAGLEEIILAFPANPEGDATSIFIHEHLAPIAEISNLKITSLGRGLSTGSELEYADPETLKSAFESRR